MRGSAISTNLLSRLEAWTEADASCHVKETVSRKESFHWNEGQPSFYWYL